LARPIARAARVAFENGVVVTPRSLRGTLQIVSAPRHRPGSVGSYALASVLLGLTACTGEIDDGRTDAEAERLQLGRIHVLLEPGDTAEDGEPGSLEVIARFAYVRGFEEEIARARIDMAVLPHDVVRPGACVPSDNLAIAGDNEGDGGEVQELVLLDAGDLQVRIGEDQLRVPLSLVPDLLPYMSGVEYLYYAEDVPDVADEARDLAVTASGSVTDELPPFHAGGTVPPALGLGATGAELGALDQDALAMHWIAGDDLLTLRVNGLVNGEARGAELTCVVPDAGAARFDLADLRGMGLAADADAYRVTASRIHTSTFDAGDFAGSELVIERREHLTLR
jgi:hypothetical protein